MMKMNGAALPRPTVGATVYFEHKGRIVSGQVRSTTTGRGFDEVVVFSAELGHTHRIDHGITIAVAALVPPPPY